MFCKWCGKEIDSDMRFCLFCGKPIKKVNAPGTNLDQSASTNLQTTMQTPKVNSANKDYKKQRRRNTTVLAIVFGIIDLLLIAVIVLSSLGVIDISINSLFNKESSEVTEENIDEEASVAHTSEPSGTVIDAKALSEFQELLCSGEWYSVNTIDTDIEIKDWEFEDIAPSWINVIAFTKNGTFHQYSTPDFDVHGFDLTDHYEIGDILNTGSPMGYIKGEEYKINGIKYRLYMVYYFDDNGYLVEVIYLKEIGTDNFYLASNANLFELIKEPDDYVISIIIPSLDPVDYASFTPGYELFISGAEDYAHELGAEIIVYNYDYTDLETAADGNMELFADAIALGSDAIIYVPFANIKIEPCLQMADDSGVPVILADYLTTLGKYPVVAIDNGKSGVLAGEITASMGEPGEMVAVISGPEVIPPLTWRLDGFVDGLTAFAPDMELIDPVYVDFTEDTGDLAEVATNDLLNAYPDLSVIFATCPAVGGPAQNVIDYTGHSDEVSLIVFNATNYSIEGLETGVVDCIIQPDYFRLGEYVNGL